MVVALSHVLEGGTGQEASGSSAKGVFTLTLQGMPLLRRITGVTCRSHPQTWLLERAGKHPHDHDARDKLFLNAHQPDERK